MTDEELAAICKVMYDMSITPEWLRHIISFDGECGCEYDTGCCDSEPTYCELWHTSKGDEEKFKAIHGITFREFREREKQKRAERERTIVAARQRVLAERDDEWGHLLP